MKVSTEGEGGQGEREKNGEPGRGTGMEGRVGGSA